MNRNAWFLRTNDWKIGLFWNSIDIEQNITFNKMTYITFDTTCFRHLAIQPHNSWFHQKYNFMNRAHGLDVNFFAFTFDWSKKSLNIFWCTILRIILLCKCFWSWGKFFKFLKSLYYIFIRRRHYGLLSLHSRFPSIRHYL